MCCSFLSYMIHQVTQKSNRSVADEQHICAVKEKCAVLVGPISVKKGRKPGEILQKSLKMMQKYLKNHLARDLLYIKTET